MPARVHNDQVMHGLGFLQDLAVVLLVAGATTVLFHRIKQPVVVGYLLAGRTPPSPPPPPPPPPRGSPGGGGQGARGRGGGGRGGGGGGGGQIKTPARR